MPANLTPDYKAAEKEYRRADSYAEKLEALKRMLALIPKHKGTDKLQADIKKRIAKLKSEPKKKGGGRRYDPSFVQPEGAGQIVLTGFPNAGKSQLLSSFTHAHPEIASYPYTTRLPQPGVLFYRKVRFQIVDGPAMSREYMESWYPNLLRYADIILLLLDLGSDDALDQFECIQEKLIQHKVELVPLGAKDERNEAVAKKRTLLLGNKIDLPETGEVLSMLQELLPSQFGLLACSATTGQGLDRVKEILFEALHIIRIFSKLPNQKADLGDPFVLPEGCTVVDAARTIHKDFAQQFKSARLWRDGAYEGQRVTESFVLLDGDILEIQVAGL